MDIDYKKEIEHIFSNKFYTLPSTLLISSSLDLALLIWKNFSIITNKKEEQEDSYKIIEHWYISGNWKDNLAHYKHNINFWNDAIKKFDYKILLDKNFNKDFPEIAQYFKKTENLTKIFFETKNLTFFKLINDKKEIKEQIYIDYLEKNASTISLSDFKQYASKIDNKDFFKDAIKNQPAFYRYLDEKYKLEEDILEYAITRSENYKYFPENLKDKYFTQWYESYKDKPYPSEIQFLPNKLQEKVISLHPDLLAYIFNSGGLPERRHVELLPFAFKRSSTKFLENVKLEKLQVNLIDDEDVASFHEELKKLISKYGLKKSNDYTYFHKLSYIASLDTELNDILQENPFYQVNKAITNKSTLENIYFQSYFSEILKECNKGKIAQDKAEELLLYAREKLSIDDLKQYRYPKKDLFVYMNRLKLSQDLEKNLDNSFSKDKRLKL